MSKRLVISLFAALLGAMLSASPGQAQRGYGRGHGQGMRSRPAVPLRGLQPGLHSLRGRRAYRPSYRGRGAYVYPYFYPPYYSSGYYSQPAPQEAPPRVVVVENAPQQVEAPPPPPPKSLVLERQGDHWVRITDSGQTEASPQAGKEAPAKATNLRSARPIETMPPRELPPAVLVFRDGHKEEIGKYAIIGGTIYANADYWNKGSWTKKVPIAELNVPATLELNRKRGSGFSLPSAPGVIAVRP